MQIVYISNRPEVLNGTLRSVSLLMPFITNAVVLMPGQQIPKVVSPDSLQVRCVAEEDLFDGNELSRMRGMDHQRKNYLLRGKLLNSDHIEATLLMSDDDSRPLTEIPMSFYLDHDKHHRYYFHNLLQWRSLRTEFDDGQIASGALLSCLGLDTLSYASHMPQIIERDIYRKARQLLETHSQSFSLCEWSTYFNFAASETPTLFHAPSAFTALCWPETPTAWKPLIEPPRYVFENYTPELYSHGCVFADLRDEYTNLQETLTKSAKRVEAWRRYSILCQHPEQSTKLNKYLKLRTWQNKLFNTQ